MLIRAEEIVKSSHCCAELSERAGRSAHRARKIDHLETQLRKTHPELFLVLVQPHLDHYPGEVRLLNAGPK